MNEPAEASPRPQILTVATLTKTHGIRGELKLRCAPEHLELLREIADAADPVTLHLPETGDEYEVTFAHVRGHESAPIIAIDGVEDRTAAEAFRGAQVRIDRDLLPPPAEDEYLLADLVGCVAYDAAGTKPRIGVVRSAEALPANVVITISLDAGGVLLAPLITDALPVTDVAERRIEVDLVFLGHGQADEAPDA